MSESKDLLLLQAQIRELEQKNKKLNYDLERVEYLLGECMILLEKVSKRATAEKDAFTAVWCDDMLQEIRKSLDLPRYGVDVISIKQIRKE